MSSSGLSEAPLCVVLDIRHPLAYLALAPAIAFGHEMQIDVDWLPLAGQTLLPPPPADPGDDRRIRHKRHRANMIAREIAVYARAQGLTLREPYRDGPPHAAHLAWLWVRARRPRALPAFLEETFRRYWALDLDAGELADAVEALRALDLEPDAFAQWATGGGPLEAERVAQALRDAAVYQTPAYVVGDELFYGRQHLPMIRWILAGRCGAVPI